MLAFVKILASINRRNKTWVGFQVFQKEIWIHNTIQNSDSAQVCHMSIRASDWQHTHRYTGISWHDSPRMFRSLIVGTTYRSFDKGKRAWTHQLHLEVSQRFFTGWHRDYYSVLSTRIFSYTWSNCLDLYRLDILYLFSYLVYDFRPRSQDYVAS
jgi:hypothetical protein